MNTRFIWTIVIVNIVGAIAFVLSMWFIHRDKSNRFLSRTDRFFENGIGIVALWFVVNAFVVNAFVLGAYGTSPRKVIITSITPKEITKGELAIYIKLNDTITLTRTDHKFFISTNQLEVKRFDTIDNYGRIINTSYGVDVKE